MKTLLRIFALSIFFTIPVAISASIVTKDTTYYSDSFEWAYTSYGDIFSQSGYTAATCDVILGKNVYVFSSSTGVLVRVNDRPNCKRYPNVLDLTSKVFSLFAPLSAGRSSGIQMDTLDTLSGSEFHSLGVSLFDVPSVYFAGDGVVFRWRVTDGKKWVVLLLENMTSHVRLEKYFPVDSMGYFSASIKLPDNPGVYSIVFVSQRVGEFSLPRRTLIRLVDRNMFFSDSGVVSRLSFSPIVTLKDALPYIDLGENLWASLQMTQDTKRFQTTGTRILFDNLPSYRPGKAYVKMSGYRIGSGGSLDRISFIPSLFAGEVLLDRMHEKIWQKFASIRNYKTYTTVKFRVPGDIQIRDSYFLTLPNGDVREFEFPLSFVGTGGYLIPGKNITLSVPTAEEGTYLIEAVRSDGIAYFNLPITRGKVWNILKPYPDESISVIRKSSEMVEKYQLSRINLLRAGLGRNMLIQDTLLDRIAQAKVDDMIARNYTGHQDPDGNYIWNFAKVRWMTYTGTLAENFAYGNISDIVLQDGLEESGSHRHTMIHPMFQKVWFWYGIANGYVYIIQVFGDT